MLLTKYCSELTKTFSMLKLSPAPMKWNAIQSHDQKHEISHSLAWHIQKEPLIGQSIKQAIWLARSSTNESESQSSWFNSSTISLRHKPFSSSENKDVNCIVQFQTLHLLQNDDPNAHYFGQYNARSQLWFMNVLNIQLSTTLSS